MMYMLLLWSNSTQNDKSAPLKCYCKLSNIICWAVSYFLPCFHCAPCTGSVWGYISLHSGGAGHFRAEMATSEVETASHRAATLLSLSSSSAGLQGCPVLLCLGRSVHRGWFNPLPVTGCRSKTLETSSTLQGGTTWQELAFSLSIFM